MTRERLEELLKPLADAYPGRTMTATTRMMMVFGRFIIVAWNPIEQEFYLTIDTNRYYLEDQIELLEDLRIAHSVASVLTAVALKEHWYDSRR